MFITQVPVNCALKFQITVPYNFLKMQMKVKHKKKER